MSARFAGTDSYVATEDLMIAVNASVTLGRPLLVKGEPGTGKTQLAEEVARSLNRPLYRWHIKSTTKAQQGLYEYDAVTRLRDFAFDDLEILARGFALGARCKEDLAVLRHVVSLFSNSARAKELSCFGDDRIRRIFLHQMPRARYFPEAETTLWPGRLDRDSRDLLTTNYPKLKIAEGTIDPQNRPTTPQLATAWEDADLYLSGSGSGFPASAHRTHRDLGLGRLRAARQRRRP